MPQIRVLQLEEDENLDSTLFRVQKGWIIRFKLGTSLQAEKVRLFCNHPQSDIDLPQRNSFYELSWISESSCLSDDGDRFASLTVRCPGVYRFFLVREDQTEETSRCHGSFLVDPVLTVGSGVLPLDSIVMQTVLSKCMGPFSEWKQRLKAAYSAGYNMIHFSPLQELGESKSSYSVKNQHSYDPVYSGVSALTDESLKSFVDEMALEWDMLSIVDVVWNHTANDTQWIREHPEASYNVVNSPHLRPAFLVDRVLSYFSQEVADGKWLFEGISNKVEHEHQLGAISLELRKQISKLRLEEYFVVNIEEMVNQFKSLRRTHQVVAQFMRSSSFQAVEEEEGGLQEGPTLEILQDPNYQRFGSVVAIDVALRLFDIDLMGCNSEENRVHLCCENFRSALQQLNQRSLSVVQSHIDAIVGNCIGHIRYHFIEKREPHVTEEHPLFPKYFTYPYGPSNIDTDMSLMDSPGAVYFMAHNGWVMGGDALKNFAAAGSNVYLRRELIAWGDNIKLNYGNKPEDSPFLWAHMKEYTERMAKIFHGFRIDNCHSTPSHVAEYFVDAARAVRRDLYVIAELFTNSETTDNLFVNSIGINSVIRESMAAHNPHDLGRHVHRYGGEAVGSFLKPAICPLQPSVAHALFVDVTHDNPSQFEARSAFNILPSSALVASACCAIGSTRGYDELVPHHIHVVKEERLYMPYGDGSPRKTYEINLESGIMKAKRALNVLHKQLSEQGYTQVYVDQVTEDIVAVTRHAPRSHQTVIIVAHCAFQRPPLESLPRLGKSPTYNRHVPPLVIPGILDEIILEAQLFEVNDHDDFRKDESFINATKNYALKIQEHIPIAASKICRLVAQGDDDASEVHFTDFLPGSVMAFKVSVKPKVAKAISVLRSAMGMFPEQAYDLADDSYGSSEVAPISVALQDVTLSDFNRILFRCDAEERDDGLGGGVYHVPGFGDLVYCGLQGFMSVLSEVRLNNDLGHPICDNLRQGDWMPGYVANRLKLNHGTRQLGLWLDSVFWYLRELPRFMIPSYFEAIISCVYAKSVELALSRMSSFVQSGSSFIKSLALGSVQMCGLTNSAPLPPVSPRALTKYGIKGSCHIMVTVAAGLPHFSTGFMRCWGRDTFIAMRGLLLVTGRYEASRNIILAFAGCLRHGLIPNLLGGGVNARYNARDATWFWLQAVQDYTKMADDGCAILFDPVKRMFPTDDSPALGPAQSEEQPVCEIIHEILQRHFEGIHFRERNAGLNLDRDMSKEGFNQVAGVDKNTGFVYGGTKHNCGTWMDKMGSSQLSQNAGHPATPRDGSAVEIVGLCKSALRWLIELNERAIYPHSTVSARQDNGEVITWTYREWASLIQDNFERKFYVHKNASGDEGEDGKLIHRRGIYKDSVGSSNKYTDFQLRPNFPIAMCVAPELFVPEHAMQALEMIESLLMGPLGLATLDPKDWAYDPYYENDIDSSLFKKAKGFNYHQGPEWTWVMGPFLRAKLAFSKVLCSPAVFSKVVQQVRKILSAHKQELLSSHWRGLPELTNKDGSFCIHSCPTQAWSMACIMELTYDMENLLRAG